jgi:hypothetical protein
MQDLFKNPVFYYIAIPIAVALWPVLIWAVYLPAAQDELAKQADRYEQADKIIEKILDIDPKRIEYTEKTDTAAEFDYASAVKAAADTCRIAATKYNFSTSLVNTSKGQKNQSANVSLDDIDIKTFARFLSTIQLRWANLQCTKVTLRAKKGGPDVWDVDMRFTYYF